jgi:hypothetical protein
LPHAWVSTSYIYYLLGVHVPWKQNCTNTYIIFLGELRLP